MKRLKTLLVIPAVAACLFMATDCPGRFRLVFDQGEYYVQTALNPFLPDSLTSELNPVTDLTENWKVYQVADDFILPEGVIPITLSLRWWGFYYQEPGQPPTDDFTIRLYEQSLVPPSETEKTTLELLDEFHLKVSRVDTGDAAHHTIGDLPIYQYDCQIQTTQIETGRRYHLCILNNTGFWRWSFFVSSREGNDAALVRVLDTPGWQYSPFDMAFQIRAMAPRP